jgi:hypothetical protein
MCSAFDLPPFSDQRRMTKDHCRLCLSFVKATEQSYSKHKILGDQFNGQSIRNLAIDQALQFFYEKLLKT